MTTQELRGTVAGTAPTFSYRLRAWIAGFAILGFGVLYLGFAAWLLWTAYQLAWAASGSAKVVAVCLVCIAFFVLRALFFVRRGELDGLTEVRAEAEPELFAVINDIAREVGAPTPKAVYLSARVNAAVFYDLSAMNLILPTRKNLEIGLGLANALNVSEFRAVLAHEFGHFAQRTMAVGRWVYIAHQIAWQVVNRRDKLDDFLGWVSKSDIRVAWVGWGFRAIIWAIRALVEIVFMGVVAAHRALSREMEFQADLVANAVGGSDALVSALGRLEAADVTWQESIALGTSAARRGGRVDCCRLQHEVRARMADILNDPTYGEPLPAERLGPEARVFASAVSAPPSMWATHPSNAAREENLKRAYVARPADNRPARTLFREWDRLCLNLACIPTEADPPVDLTDADVHQLVQGRFFRASFEPRYKGVYLWRSCAWPAASWQELIGPLPTDLSLAARQLYPDDLRAVVERWRALDAERDALLAVLRETGNSGTVHHRGHPVERARVPQLVRQVTEEFNEVDASLRAHERSVRAYHMALARAVGRGWPDYLAGLIHLLHYTTHANADLGDARRQYHATVQRELARRKVNDRGRAAILMAAQELYDVLAFVHGSASHVGLDALLAERVGIQNWAETLQSLELGAPTAANLGDWARAADSWVDSAIDHLGALKAATLDHLLITERYLADATNTDELPDAPTPSRVPARYVVRTPDGLRPEVRGDETPAVITQLTMMGKTLAAACVLFAVVAASSSASRSDVVVLNGLARPVRVSMNETSTTVPPLAHRRVAVGNARSLQVAAQTDDGQSIEAFTQAISPGSTEVYNVASASPLVRWTATYGSAPERPPQYLGAPRWLSASASVIFEEPPKSVSTKSGGTTLQVLSAPTERSPDELVNLMPESDATAAARMVRAHLQWDPEQSSAGKAWRQWVADLQTQATPSNAPSGAGVRP